MKRYQIVRSKFLLSIWKPHPSNSWLFVAAKKGTRWIEVPLKNNRQLEMNLRSFFKTYTSRKYDLYFCPNAFKAKTRKGVNAISGPYAWCDIDDGKPQDFNPRPSIVWETSKSRYQGLWIFSKNLSPSRAESISKHLAYEFGGDRNCWTVTKALRIPGTFNNKPERNNERVRLRKFLRETIDPSYLLRKTRKQCQSNKPEKPLKLEFNLEQDPNALFKKYNRRITHTKVRALLRDRVVREPDRSKQVFTIITALSKASVPWGDIACFVWHSPYFRTKHGKNVTALENEIHRAMRKVQ